MKIEMSVQAIENRLRLVGELTKACLMINPNKSGKQLNDTKQSVLKNALDETQKAANSSQKLANLS